MVHKMLHIKIQYEMIYKLSFELRSSQMKDTEVWEQVKNRLGGRLGK